MTRFQTVSLSLSWIPVGILWKVYHSWGRLPLLAIALCFVGAVAVAVWSVAIEKIARARASKKIFGTWRVPYLHPSMIHLKIPRVEEQLLAYLPGYQMAIADEQSAQRTYDRREAEVRKLPACSDADLERIGHELNRLQAKLMQARGVLAAHRAAFDAHLKAADTFGVIVESDFRDPNALLRRHPPQKQGARTTAIVAVA